MTANDWAGVALFTIWAVLVAWLLIELAARLRHPKSQLGKETAK